MTLFPVSEERFVPTTDLLIVGVTVAMETVFVLDRLLAVPPGSERFPVRSVETVLYGD